MVMPKKGLRKIKVDNKEYKYKIRGSMHHYYVDFIAETTLIIELEANKYYTETRENGWVVTPKIVREIIEREVKNEF